MERVKENLLCVLGVFGALALLILAYDVISLVGEEEVDDER